MINNQSTKDPLKGLTQNTDEKLQSTEVIEVFKDTFCNVVLILPALK
ncbi:rCG44627 [Rattus norvegicus]|uniref:RCG44627 n=1 Tax=Rattus norvegicus TaxID=10116 RepID=A6I4X5_RAT|nr:rCG44627 [Rattus norvegicus]